MPTSTLQLTISAKLPFSVSMPRVFCADKFTLCTSGCCRGREFSASPRDLETLKEDYKPPPLQLL